MSFDITATLSNRPPHVHCLVTVKASESIDMYCIFCVKDKEVTK